MGLAYRLSFTLPPVLAFSVPAGRHQPCLAGCALAIGPRPSNRLDHSSAVELPLGAGDVLVIGPSREAVFDQAARFFRIVAKGHTLSIEAILTSPPRYKQRFAGADPDELVETVPGGRDSYTITLNAEITFSASTRAPEIYPRLPPRPWRGTGQPRGPRPSKFVPSFV
jgi:hypothetical protein